MASESEHEEVKQQGKKHLKYDKSGFLPLQICVQNNNNNYLVCLNALAPSYSSSLGRY